MNSLTEQLEALGLSDTESKLYLAGLQEGPSTVQTLALAAEIKRTSAYPALENLQKFGLAQAHKEGRKTVFHVEHPEKLNDLLAEQRASLIERETLLQNLIPELQTFVVEKGESVDAQFLVKPEQIRELLTKTFLPEEKVYILGSDALLAEYLDELDFLQKFLLIRSQRDVQTNILTDSLPSSLTIPSTLSMRKTQKDLSFESVLVFSKGQFLQIHLNARLTGLHIKNKDFMDLLSFFFDFIWDTSEERV